MTEIKPTIIVAGMTRSGLTLTMSMLQAAGVECAGEYPFEPYQIGEIPWAQMHGKAVKVVDTQNQIPPKQHGPYHVILLKRDFKEQAKSIEKFIRFFGQNIPAHAKGNVIVKSLEADYKEISSWARKQERCEIVKFEDLIDFPEIKAHSIYSLVSGGDMVRQEILEKMAAVVVKRSAKCYPTMLETELIESQKKEIRLWHFAFGWCKLIDVRLKPGADLVLKEFALVDLEADEIEYYSMGIGNVNYKRNKDGHHYFTAPLSDFFESEQAELPGILSLKHTALNPKVRFNEKPK